MAILHAAKALYAAKALGPEGWREDARLTVRGGVIEAVDFGVPAQPEDERHAILIPGVPNLHSHAFQRGMAGLAERRAGSTDTFWVWRETMYRFANAMSPEQMEAVATLLYVEMLEAGFTRVAEFHYLHHAPDGCPYDDPAEMAARIAAAAAASGIGLTLLPVFYAHGDFGGAPATAGQRRFLSDLDGFERLLRGCEALARQRPGTIVGVAPHSLRAATPDEIAAVIAMAPEGPVHIHAAEQVKEVDDCLAWSGRRPVASLLDAMPVDARWCLIHATHMDADEVARLGATGAVVGLCPITEGNLGDGLFAAPTYLAGGGAFGIGTDSNVLIGVADELRQLEYALRLATRTRNVLAPEHGSTGTALVQAAVRGGTRAACGDAASGLAVGASADIVSLDASHVALCNARTDDLLDAFVFCAGTRLIDCVWAGGEKLVENGRHRLRGEATRLFNDAMRALLAM